MSLKTVLHVVTSCHLNVLQNDNTNCKSAKGTHLVPGVQKHNLSKTIGSNYNTILRFNVP